MKLNKFSNYLVIGLVLTLAAAGCTKKPTPLTPLPNGKGIVGNGSGNGNDNTPPLVNPDGGKMGDGNPMPTPQANPGDFEKYTPNAEIFKDDTVHFAYDSSVVRPSEKPKVAKIADYMKANSSNALRIEAHCDERGTDQYNFSLGERRALALREELISLGADGGKILTVSYGRSRPVDTGHSDAAHARNRRGEFILLTPPQ